MLDYKEFPILYVDDEPENLRIFELTFRREFSIITATSADEGLQRIRAREVLASDDEYLIEHSRYLATQARQPVRHYEHHEVGYNYRMSNILAAIGIGSVEELFESVPRQLKLDRPLCLPSAMGELEIHILEPDSL